MKKLARDGLPERHLQELMNSAIRSRVILKDAYNTGENGGDIEAWLKCELQEEVLVNFLFSKL